MTLGQKIRQMRLARGMTQAQAAGTQITRNMLSQIENDQAKPSLQTLEYLAQVLEVSVGWLMADETADSPSARLSQARALLRAGEYEACMKALDQEEPEEEERMMLAVCACRLSRKALENEDCQAAQTLANKALAWSRESLYRNPGIELEASGVAARCALSLGKDAEAAEQAYKTLYLQQQQGVRYHLFLARSALEQEHIQAAEREIWSIAELPDRERPEYLLLRGRIAMKKEQYETAALYLQQAESLNPESKLLLRELYHCREVCATELGDYKQAYAYVEKQRKLQ